MILHYNGTDHIISPEDNSYRNRTIMGENALTIYFAKPVFEEIPVGAYCDFDGERFTLMSKQNFKKNGSRDYEYILILHAVGEKLTRFKFYDFAGGGYIFSLTAKPAEHVQMIVNVLNAKDAGWTVGDVIDSSEIVLNYNHNNCMEALAMICSEAETEFEITSAKVINVRKTEYNKETPLELSYGQGNGLKPGIERKNDEKSRPVERLMVQGGTRNIDYSSYGSRYLLLPKSQTLVYNGHTYTTDAGGLYIQRGDKAIETGQEDSLDASTIYPSRVCIVTSVEPINAETNLYNVTDSTIPEALNFEENLIAGQSMTIVYQTGMLTGKEFDVKYTHEGRLFEIVPKEIDGYYMPGGVYLPVAGDTFVVYGSSLPDAYICDNATKTGASWDMFREAVEYMYEHEEENYSYAGPLSAIWLKDNWATVSGKIKLGGYCSLTDPELGGVLIRIRSIKDMVNNRYDITLDLSNALVKASFSTTLAKLNSYTASLTVQQLTELRNQLIAMGIDVTDIDKYLANMYYMSYNDLLNYLKIVLGGSVTDSNSKLISGTIVWKSGLTYESTEMKYKILGISYTADPTTLTLEDSDPVYDRIDVFYLDSNGNLKIKTGAPGAVPAQPTLTELELFVSSAYIEAGALVPKGITVVKVYDEKTGDEWTPTASVDAGNTTIDIESTVDPYSGTKHIDISIDVTETSTVHQIGEEYQGGIIFWIDPASDGKKGLIAAKNDTVTDVFWSRLSGYAIYSTNGRDASIGSGQANSAAMLATPAAAAQAIKYVNELVIAGFSDWFIGSEREMQALWNRRYEVGNFNPTRDYWTSTESEWDTARMIHWDNGVMYTRDKNERRNVRAIRKFDDTVSSSLTTYAPEETNTVFTSPSEITVIDGILSFRMKTSKAWKSNSILLIEAYKGAIKTGKCAVSAQNDLFGFNVSNTEEYQLVAIPYSNFILTQNKLDAFKFSLEGSWPNEMNLLIDSVIFQYTNIIPTVESGKVLQVQDQVLKVDKWVADGDIFSYTYENPKIRDTSIVDVIPLNDDIELVKAAGFFPETVSEAGYVQVFAKLVPTADIRITVNITEGVL